MTQAEQCAQLTRLGVDFLGFIFYEKSPRYVLNHLNLKEIAEIFNAKKVGVFVNESISIISKIASEAQLDAIQLHGDETSEFVAALCRTLPDLTIIKVLRVGSDAQALQEQLNLFNENQNIDALLFDTDSKAFGGTGKAFNWELLNQMTVSKPYFLSGGISCDNYLRIKNLETRPAFLDINSKFETQPGIKNLGLIQDFILKIRNHDL